MGKKTKIGKQRQDKYYHLAKETGYRSRAAFKLIQLNKRFEFLQRSRALVDLCAAPGGWLQVAAQNMPLSSVCIGMDLVPIKPINKCITLQGDITEEKSRQMVRKELCGWEADCVLHDGAPNISGHWIQDAFQQNCLTLSALRLATQILSKNGVFVTKVFRSSDYQSLIDVFEKLFKEVHVWKPAASRLESAEIFVVCEKYTKPVKVDPDLLDVKKVFAEAKQQAVATNPQLLLQPKKKEKRVKALGYDVDSLTTYKAINATQFIQSSDYLNLLSSASQIIIDDKRWEEEEITNDEVRQCLSDIKVCGPRELRSILVWRKKILKKINDENEEKHEPQGVDDPPKDVDSEEERMAEINDLIKNAKAGEKAALKRNKRKMLKSKADLMKRKQLKMVIEGDQFESNGELELFSLKKVSSAKDSLAVAQPIHKSESDSDEGSDDDHSSIADGIDEVMDNTDQIFYEQDPGLSKVEQLDARKSNWFQRGEIANVIDDEEEALRAVEKFMGNKNSSKKADESDGFEEAVISSSNESKAVPENFGDDESDEEFIDADKTDSKRSADSEAGAGQQPVKKQRLTPELLALGEKMIYSSKTRRDLEEWGWNRYTNNDEDLPNWFVDDEKKHFKKELPVSKDRVEFYKNRIKELNTRTIKKVAEAKARKRRRRDMKVQQMRKRAEGILDSENMEHAEKLREVKKLYRKTSLNEKKKVSYVVMTKAKRGGGTRPKGPYKVVDARLKKDNRSKRTTVKTSRHKRGTSQRHDKRQKKSTKS